ncbi:MAG: DUF1294 domain-containing protein [Clostridiales bacterium]|nr:DUF1294 domain-containing protein [Clostridiales bacterium]
MQFWHWAIIWYVVMNLAGFIAYAADKSFALNGKRRIMERDLILLAVLGGPLGCLLGMILCHHKTRKKKFTLTVPLFLVWYIFLTVFLTYQNNNLVITDYDLDTGLGLRVVEISDLHNMQVMWDKDRISRETKELEPDIIVLTGDIVDSIHTDIDSALYTAGELAKIADTYYVTGNHEYRLSQDDYFRLMDGLASVGVKVLSNSYEILGEGGKEYALIGLEDYSLEDPTLSIIMSEIRSTKGADIPAVVLAHEPQYIENYASCGADIVFTGHAHGGQVVLPGDKPLVAPDQGLFPKYANGVVNFGDTKMVISRGLGNSAIPFRINNFPEIVVCEM